MAAKLRIFRSYALKTFQTMVNVDDAYIMSIHDMVSYGSNNFSFSELFINHQLFLITVLL